MILSLSQKASSQTTYKYYVALKNYTSVPNNFNKADLLSYINGIYSSSSLYNTVNSSVSIVKKSIPNAKTPVLKKCITILSTNPNLVSFFNSYTAHFEYPELIPPLILAYTPNDYFGCASRTDSLSPTINGVKNNQSFTSCSNTQLDLIRAREAWDITTGHSKIKIGISDNYLDRYHDDIVNILDTFYVIDGGGAHGTQVAGAAVGHSNNGKGIASIAGNKCKLVFNSWSQDLTGCVIMSQRKGVRVINANWGWRGGSSTPYISDQMINEIVDSNNVVFVSAAGNGKCWGCDTSCACSDTQWVYPAAYNKALCVTSIGYMETPGSTNRYVGFKKEFSWKNVHINKDANPKGNSHHHNSRVDVCAPGYLTTLLCPGGGNCISSGTSYASPMVSGLCALVASVNPCLTAQQIINIVKSTADASIYNISYNQPFIGKLGTGRVDAYQAVKLALDQGTNFQQNKPVTGTGKYPTGTTIIWGATKILAGRNVTTGTQGDVIIPQGSIVKYDANIEVELGAGFEDKSGNFEIRQKDSPCY